MATISELKERIKKQANIVEVIRRFEPLKRAGSEWTCLCPFHKEKSPSFMVDPAKQIFKCFGCGAGGDVIEFVMQHQGLGYVEALNLIATQENIPVSFEREDNRSKNDGFQPKPLLDAKFVEREIMAKTLNLYETNELAVFLASRVGWDETLKTLIKYFVGTAKQRGTIFWQVDQFMRVRTGQKIHYGPDGHRLKTVDIKRLYTQKEKYYPCIYGEHQLLQAEHDALVVIVESEKSAIICDLWQPCGPNVLYMASVGMNGMTDEKIWALKGMRVCLCPDFSYLSRATWGVLPMRKKYDTERGRMVPAADGEEDKEYISVSKRLQKVGCEVSFFDPYPERNDGKDIADILVEQPWHGILQVPNFSTLTLSEIGFE